MEIKSVTSVYCCQSASEKRIATAVSSVISDTVTSLDICAEDSRLPELFSDSEVLVVTMPVFGGRLSELAAEKLSVLSARGTPAVAIVVCGSEGYGDSLLELFDLLAARGFCVVGAAAFVADGETRPDDGDFSRLVEFASACERKLEEFCGCRENLSIPGNRPYRERASKKHALSCFFAKLFHRGDKKNNLNRPEPEFFV